LNVEVVIGFIILNGCIQRGRCIVAGDLSNRLAQLLLGMLPLLSLIVLLVVVSASILEEDPAYIIVVPSSL
jgi:hypothetical protein